MSDAARERAERLVESNRLASAAEYQREILATLLRIEEQGRGSAQPARRRTRKTKEG